MLKICSLLLFLFVTLVIGAPNEKRDFLTHLVIPYHYVGISKLLDNIKRWNIFPPYHNRTEEFPAIIFYSSGGHLDAKEKAALEEAINSTLIISVNGDPNIINHIQHIHAKLNKSDINSHLVGSRVMFDLFLYFYSYKTIGGNPIIFFYMEPDCLPIRKGWLDQIIRESDSRSGRFWIQGSLYRGGGPVLLQEKGFSLPFFFHINGNAMYNIGPNSALREFYLNSIETSEIRDTLLECWHNASQIPLQILELKAIEFPTTSLVKRPFRAYDMAIAHILLEPKNFIKLRAYLHKFLYTDVVQNHWYSEYCLEDLKRNFPETYLIHGGQDNPSICQNKTK